MSMMDNAYIRMMCVKHAIKETVKERFVADERGAIGIIEIVIIIAVVLVIGALFWDEITGFVTGLMDSVFGGDDSLGTNVNEKINANKAE